MGVEEVNNSFGHGGGGADAHPRSTRTSEVRQRGESTTASQLPPIAPKTAVVEDSTPPPKKGSKRSKTKAQPEEATGAMEEPTEEPQTATDDAPAY